MKYALSIAAVVAATTCISASPVEISARQYSSDSSQSNSSAGQASSSTGMMVGSVAQGITDGDIFNVALSLEHLEAAFYQQALGNYTASDFQNAGLPAVTTSSLLLSYNTRTNTSQAFINNVATLASQEDVHVA